MIDVDRIRADFPGLADRIHGEPLTYLDNAATTQKPRVVLDRIADLYSRGHGNIHRGVHALGERASGAYEQARETVRRFLGAASTSEIVFTPGATSGINLVATAFGQAFVGPGDEILISRMEHHSNIVPWQLLCERTGATLRVVPLCSDSSLDLDALDRLLTPRTRLLAVTYVSNVLGTVNPVAEIVRRARARSVPVLIDGAQAVQHLPVDVQDIDCDFLVFSGHKVYAETGIGVLYGKREWLDRLPPASGGGGMVQTVTLDGFRAVDPPLKFEAGTPHFVGAASLAAAIEYLESIGLDAIRSHEQEVMEYALRRLRSIEGLVVHGAPPSRCGSIAFDLEGTHPYDLGMILDKLGIAVRTGTHCAEPVMRHLGVEATVRASFALYNTARDVDALVEGLTRAATMLRLEEHA